MATPPRLRLASKSPNPGNGNWENSGSVLDICTVAWHSIPVQINGCLRCENKWVFRGVGRALRCGVCGSPYWDQERKGGKGANFQVAGKGVVRGPVEQKFPRVGRRVRAVPNVVSESGQDSGAVATTTVVVAPAVDMAALRAICAGDVPRPATVFGGYAAVIEEHLAEDGSAPSCSACEEPMRESKGKWACVDQACGMCGVEQKLKRQK